MSELAIKFENISKQYRLGTIGTGMLSHDLKRWWTVNVLGKEDPFLKIGSVNDRAAKADSDYVWALRDIDFEVKQGEVLGIIGKNGAGKSTLLKILSRVTAPTTGRITAYGRIASLLEVGTGFHPEMTGRENIFMNGSIMGMTKFEIRSKMDEIVDFAGVQRYIDTPVKRYSSGMTVRLGFAIAAHLEPEILVVDEVLAVGDAEFQKKAIGKMQDVSRDQGRTVLFVSHNMTSIANLCSKICVLKDGTVFFLGELVKGIESYLSSSAAKSIVGPEGVVEKLEFPVDNEFQLRELRISQEGHISPDFYTNVPIKIKYLYTVRNNIYGLRIGFDLIENSTGTVIFRTFHDDRTENDVHQKGHFSAIACIPANFIKPGSYRIQVAIGIHNVRWISFEKISAPINIYNIDGINKNYADFRPGIIMPSIDWEHKKINEIL